MILSAEELFYEYVNFSMSLSAVNVAVYSVVCDVLVILSRKRRQFVTVCVYRDYSRRERRQFVAYFGDYSRQCGQGFTGFIMVVFKLLF